MRSLRMLSPDASSLDALARLLPSAACRVLLQHRHHRAVVKKFRQLQGSKAPLCVCVCVCVCARARARVSNIYLYICIYNSTLE
jgi:hypothetical protein